MADVSELLIEVKNVNNTLNDIDKVGKKLKQTQQEAANFGKTLFAGWSFTKLIQGAKAFGDAWKDTLVTFRNFNAVFGDFNSTAVNGAKELENAFQMTEKGAKKFLATIASRVNFGLDDKELGKISTDLAKLSHEIGAFYGMDASQVSLKLTNSLSGMTKGLKEFGISIDTSSPRFKNLVDEMMQSTGKTREAARELVIYNEILKQGKKFEGAFAKSTKSLSQSFDNISNTLKDGAFAKAGEILSAIFVPILEKVNALLNEPWAKEILGIVAALGLVLASVIAIRTAMVGLTSMLKTSAIFGNPNGLLSGILKEIGGAIKWLFAGLAKYILIGVSSVVTFIAGLPAVAIAAIIAVLTAGVVLLINKLTTGEWFNFSGMVDAVVGWFDKLGQRIINLFKGRGWNTDDEILEKLKKDLENKIRQINSILEGTDQAFIEWQKELADQKSVKSTQDQLDLAAKRLDKAGDEFKRLNDEVEKWTKMVNNAPTGYDQARYAKWLKKLALDRDKALEKLKQADAQFKALDKKQDQIKFSNFTWYQDAMRKIKDALGQTITQDKIKDIEDRIKEFKKTFYHMTPEEQKEAYKELSRMELEKFQLEMDNINKEKEALRKTNEMIKSYVERAMEWKPQGTEGIAANTMEGYKFMTSGFGSLASLGPVLQNSQKQQADLQKKANDIAAATKTSIDAIKQKIDALTTGNTTKIQIVQTP